MDADVMIVGAGPAGLTLAIDLARRGVSALVVEQRAEPAPGSKGKGLQPRTLEVFDDLGVVEDVLAIGRPYPKLLIHDGMTVVAERTMFEQRAAAPDVPYPNTIMLPQPITERILRERLAALGGAVRFGTALTAFADEGEHVAATIEGPDGTTTVRVRYLVGADGGHSTVRRLAGIPLEGETPALQGMIVADVSATGIDRSGWHVWATAASDAVGLVPLPGTDQFQFNAPLPHGAEADLTLPALQQTLDARTGGGVTLTGLTWASAFRPNLRMAGRFRDGRVFLAGDAAHVHPPTGGQGLNTSVQDSYNLGWKLHAVLRGAPDALLDSYEAERLPIAAAVLGLSDSLLRRGLAGDEAALRRGQDEQQLGIGYPDSPLSLPGGGNRVPNKPRTPRFVMAGDVLTRPDGYAIGRFATRADAEAHLGALLGPALAELW